MATRTAGSGTLYALVLFVFLFIFSVALAILMYSQKINIEAELAQARDVSGNLINDAEQRSDAYLVAMDKRGAATVFGYMNNENEALKRRLIGSGSAPLEQVERQLAMANLTHGVNALQVINDLRGEVAAQKESLASAETASANIAKEVEALKAQLASLQQARDREVAALNKQVADRVAEWKAYETKSDAERAQLLQRMQEAQVAARTQINALETALRAKQNELDIQVGRNSELIRILQRHQLNAPDATLEADGRITDVNARDNTVYIDLGRNDRLILGMTFEVFDASTGVQTEVDDSRVPGLNMPVHVGGKASIEVVRFSESGRTAICRVVRQAYGRPIVTGDLISNIVYDKQRTYRFFVFGEFDMNDDGIATSAERQRVVDIIREWGGHVIEADTMPADTDFLVLGRNIDYPPALPDNPPPTPEEIEKHQRDRALYRAYEELLGLARQLSVPVLNQNRFLILTGQHR